jgi:hypothetical protein
LEKDSHPPSAQAGNILFPSLFIASATYRPPTSYAFTPIQSTNIMHNNPLSDHSCNSIHLTKSPTCSSKNYSLPGHPPICLCVHKRGWNPYPVCPWDFVADCPLGRPTMVKWKQGWLSACIWSRYILLNIFVHQSTLGKHNWETSYSPAQKQGMIVVLNDDENTRGTG